MAKRRRCRDKLPHHEHEWGQGANGRKTYVALQASGFAGIQAKVPQYWCPGVTAMKEQE
jgi:hypothetical protein